jgi:hypothetical protein
MKPSMFGMLIVAGASIGGTSASTHSTLQSSQPQQQQQRWLDEQNRGKPLGW